MKNVDNKEMNQVIEYVLSLSEENISKLVGAHIGAWAEINILFDISIKEFSDYMHKYRGIDISPNIGGFINTFPNSLKGLRGKKYISKSVLSKGKETMVRVRVNTYPIYVFLLYMHYKGNIIIEMPRKESSKETCIELVNKIMDVIKDKCLDLNSSRCISYMYNSCYLRITGNDAACLILERANYNNLSQEAIDYLTEEELGEMQQILEDIYAKCNAAALSHSTLTSVKISSIIVNCTKYLDGKNNDKYMTDTRVHKLIRGVIERLSEAKKK